jgi:hypothetical protein
MRKISKEISLPLSTLFSLWKRRKGSTKEISDQPIKRKEKREKKPFYFFLFFLRRITIATGIHTKYQTIPTETCGVDAEENLATKASL